MRVQFERSGGVAGMRLTATIDSDELTPEEARQLEDMVRASGFFDLPPALPASPGADRFQYMVTIEAGERTHTVQTDDGAVPSAMRPLLNWATTMARKRRAGR